MEVGLRSKTSLISLSRSIAALEIDKHLICTRRLLLLVVRLTNQELLSPMLMLKILCFKMSDSVPKGISLQVNLRRLVKSPNHKLFKELAIILKRMHGQIN